MNSELRICDADVRIFVSVDQDIDIEVLNGRRLNPERDDRRAPTLGRRAVLDTSKFKAHFKAPVLSDNRTVEAAAGRASPPALPGSVSAVTNGER